MYLTLHSYGQMILYPWGYDRLSLKWCQCYNHPNSRLSLSYSIIHHQHQFIALIIINSLSLQQCLRKRQIRSSRNYLYPYQFIFNSLPSTSPKSPGQSRPMAGKAWQSGIMKKYENHENRPGTMNNHE